MQPPSARRLDLLSGTLLVVMWSSGFVGAQLGTRYASPDTLLGWRYTVAGSVLLVVLVTRRPGGELLRAVPRLAFVALLCLCLYLGGVFLGVSLGVSAGVAALVAALQPLLVAVASGPLLGERTTRAQAAGLVLGLIGVALVVATELGSGSAGPAAYLCVVGGMLALATGTLTERRFRVPVSLLESLTVQSVTAAVFFLVVAGVDGHLVPPATPGFWWSVAWMVLLATFGGYGCYLWVLRRGGANRASTLLFLTPPTTAVWAYLMFGSHPGLLAVPGALVCATGVWLVVRRPARVTPPEPVPVAPRPR
jgi:drug/metabolite transporter (DMT)-like permease